MKSKKVVKEEVEADRDSKWIDHMSLYVPSILEFSSIEGVTVEKVVDYFVNNLQKQNNPPEQKWGLVEVKY